MSHPDSIDYMTPPVPGELPLYKIPIIETTSVNFKDYGTIVTNPKTHPVEIVQWPQPDWRPVDPDTGNEGGYAEGAFTFYWQGDTLYAESEVLDKRESKSRPTQGIASIRTIGKNQDGTVVMSYDRSFLVPKQGHGVEDKLDAAAE